MDLVGIHVTENFELYFTTKEFLKNLNENEKNYFFISNNVRSANNSGFYIKNNKLYSNKNEINIEFFFNNAVMNVDYSAIFLTIEYAAIKINSNPLKDIPLKKIINFQNTDSNKCIVIPLFHINNNSIPVILLQKYIFSNIESEEIDNFNFHSWSNIFKKDSKKRIRKSMITFVLFIFKNIFGRQIPKLCINEIFKYII